MHKKQAYTILTATFIFIVLIILAIQFITIYNSKPKIIDFNIQPDLDLLDKAINTTNVNLSNNDYWWDNCNANIALNSMNFNGCYEVRNRDQRNNCFYDIALNRSSIGECFQIRFSELQQKCVYTIATKSLDPENCDFMNDGINKYQCYQKIAKTLKNSSICDYIESKQIRQSCMNSTLSVE